jgi:hypothetical protein
MRRGCVTIITVLSLVILVVAVFFFVVAWPEHKRRGTSQNIYYFEKMMEEYKADHGAYPQGGNEGCLAALGGDNKRDKVYLSSARGFVENGQFIDFYRTPLRFEFPQDARVRITSAGPDKTFDTEDDLTSSYIREISGLTEEP